MVKYIWIAMVFWALCNSTSAQIADTRGVDFYREFGAYPALSFLKNIDLGDDIYQAVLADNAKALGGYAAILFHAQRVSGLSSQVTGIELLEKATKIAMEENDTNTLRALAQEWQEPYFGPGNKKKAMLILRFIDTPLSGKIQLLPEWKEVLPGGKIIFRVIYKDTGREIAPEELSFDAQRGHCLANLYLAPKNNCNDIVQVKRLSSGQSAQAVIVVKGKKRVSLPKISVSPWVPDSNKIIVDLYPTLEFYDAQQLLLKEEQARLTAKENIAREIERILSFAALYDHAFDQVRAHFSICRGTILTGVKTSEPYLYKGEQKIRVVASVSSKWVIDSLRKNCRKNGVAFSKTMKKRILNVIPKTIKAEGVASDGF